MAKEEFIRLSRSGDGYIARFAVSECMNPLVFSTIAVRTVGAIFLHELDAIDCFAKSELEGAIDLAAVHLGFGVLLLSGSAIEIKGCSGMKVHSATSLGAAPMALALAISCALEKEAPAQFARYLGGAALSMFTPAVRFARANGSVVRAIDDSPASIEGEYFKLKEGGGLLSRLLPGVFGEKDELAELEREVALALAKKQKQRDPAKEERLREIRAMVEETLSADVAGE